MSRFTREPVDVPDLLERDKLVHRLRKIRKEAVLDKNTFEHWNRTHPEETPLDTSFWDEVIAWCDSDGTGPFPTRPPDSGTTPPEAR